jgi:hypothetical protein
MDDLLNALQEIDPLWSVAFVALALIVLLAAKLWRASFGRALALGATAVVLAVVLAGAYYGYQHLEDTRRLAERKVLEERAAALFSQTMQPGTVFACLDGSPAPAMMEACERVIFMEPQRVAAAVSIVTQRLAFLSDALQFASTRDPSYHTRLESLRNSIEADAYGFVAYVLSLDHRCSADACEQFQLLRDASRVRENLRVRRFEAFMAKHGPAWREAAPAGAVRESPLPPGGASRPSVSGVTIADPVSAGEGSTAARSSPPAQPAVQPQMAVPTAALAPEVTPPTEVAPEPTPAAAAEPTPPVPPAKPAQPAKGAQPGGAAKSAAPAGAPKIAPKPKAAADPVSKRSNEPVAGLPRVVPRDYIRDKEEEPATQVSGQTPGAPLPIGPQQNFTGR